MATYVKYMRKTLKILRNYMDNISKYEKEYYLSKSGLYDRSKYAVKETYNIQAHELKIVEIYRKANRFYNELCEIAKRFKNGIEVEQELRNFNDKLNQARLPKFETIMTLKTVTNSFSKDTQYGTITGGAAMPTEPRKADFSGQAKNNWNIQKNIDLNSDYSDAKEFANIFLVSPENTPESEEYKFIKPGYAETLNLKYNLKKEKKIDKNWSGFVYSRYSSLAKNVSNFSGLKSQLAAFYNEETGQFKTDKIDINFKEDRNLFRALGHATVLEPQIDDKGYFHGILFDKYDFKLNYKDTYDDAFITAANNYFWLLQQLSLNKNFYILAPIYFKW